MSAAAPALTRPWLGEHYLVDLYGCDPARLADEPYVRASMLASARAAGATIIGSQFHRFEPHGVSGVVVIAESHLTIHTWPERRYAAVDLFTCGVGMRPQLGIDLLCGCLGASRRELVRVARGRALAAAGPAGDGQDNPSR